MGKEITSITMRKGFTWPPKHGAETPEVSASRSVRDKSLGLIWNISQYLLFAVVGVAVIFDSGLGQLLIGFLGLLGIVFKFPSKLAFGAALFLLVTIPLFIALKREGIANTLAIYVFELLVVGTVLAIIELRRSVSQAVDLNDPMN